MSRSALQPSLSTRIGIAGNHPADSDRFYNATPDEAPAISTRSLSWFWVVLLALLAGALAVQLAAQAPKAFGHAPAWDSAQEITVDGAIQEVVTHHTPGSPLGLHVLVSTQEGSVVDAHLGPYVDQQTRETLAQGSSAQFIGIMQQINGRQYLVVREVTVAGRTVTIRTENGILVRQMASPSEGDETTPVRHGGAQ
ncbi:MAG TPA: hypothetical protein VGR96_04315 [Acidobacteriaceae bacterium]|nr:hypothetical protein [Acidobacteriaceae bacterium]